MDAAAEQGRDPPPGFEFPEIWEDAEPYWQAFRVLDRTRPQAGTMRGLIPLPVTYPALSQYIRDFELGQTLGDFEAAVTLLRAMDDAMLELEYARLVPPEEKNKGDML